MSVNRDPTYRPSDLDGSDGPPVVPKTQQEYKEDVKAYLGAARETLRNMTGAALEDMRSDPNMDPAYFSCIKELLHLNGAPDGRKTRRVDDEHDQTPILRGGISGSHYPIGQQPATWPPKYAFTVHFLPQNTPKESNRDRPLVSSALAEMIPVMASRSSISFV